MEGATVNKLKSSHAPSILSYGLEHGVRFWSPLQKGTVLYCECRLGFVSSIRRSETRSTMARAVGFELIRS